MRRKAKLASKELSVVIPTLDEAENIARAISQVSFTLSSVDHEILVVDDSPDPETSNIVRELQAEFPQVRLMRRENPDCLSGAILDGFNAARGRLLAVIDADLQHDVRLLEHMALRTLDSSLVIGSRYCVGGGSAGWSLVRHLSSRITSSISKVATGVRVSDPLSGFFCIGREAYQGVADSIPRQGWKILLEMVAQLRSDSIIEIPYSFTPRIHGSSKLSKRVVCSWALQVCRLSIRRFTFKREGRSIQLSEASR